MMTARTVKKENRNVNSTRRVMRHLFTKQCLVVFIIAILFLSSILNLRNQHILDSSRFEYDERNTDANFLPSSSFSEELHFIVQHAPGARDCGGCDVLNELIESLIELGFNVLGNPKIQRCPDPGNIESIVPSNRTLVFVHPEINAFSCAHLFPNRTTVTVRWILAPPGIKSVPLKKLNYKWDELVFNYGGPNMIEATSHRYSNTLMVLKNPYPGDETDISDELFHNTNRSGILWTMRKGHSFHSNITYIHEQPGIPATEMDKSQPPIKVQDLVKYEYFISYDPATYWNVLAAMSGTVSIVYPLAGQTKEEWATTSFVAPYLHEIGKTEIPGIAYGWNDSEILFSRHTMHRVRPFFIDMKRWGKETVARFTRDCYRYKNGTRTNFEAGLLVKDAYPSLFKQDA